MEKHFQVENHEWCRRHVDLCCQIFQIDPFFSLPFFNSDAFQWAEVQWLQLGQAFIRSCERLELLSESEAQALSREDPPTPEARRAEKVTSLESLHLEFFET